MFENTIWKGDSEYTDSYNRNFSALVPDMDSADTVEGEMLRAASRLYYDQFNNGFTNNTSGAVNYLKQFEMELKISTELYFLGSLASLCEYQGGHTSRMIDEAVEKVMNAVLDYIDSKEGHYQPNTVDMFDFSDPDEYHEDEEDDEYY